MSGFTAAGAGSSTSSANPPKHDWSLPVRTGLAIEESNEYQNIADAPPVLQVEEAERLVEGLTKFTVEEVGNSRWMEQHRNITKLNLQAHQSAMARSDEFVLEALLTFNKVEVLIHELLLVEAWKEFNLPELRKTERVKSGKVNMRLHFILYHEATLSNLLEVLLFHRHVCEELGGDLMVELVDYSARKILLLNSSRSWSTPKLKNALNNTKDSKAYAQEIEKRAQEVQPSEELSGQIQDIDFRVCITAVTVMRYICEWIERLPLIVLTRVLDTHDVLLGLVCLVENPPWTRRLGNGKWEKFQNFAWTEVKTIDLLKVTQTEAQVWLAIFFLTCKPDCRSKYHFNSFRKNCVLRCRKYINDILLDQLPVLADVQRYMDELTLMEVPEPHQVPQGNLLMEQVPVVRDSYVKRKDWTEVAAKQVDEIFAVQDDSTDQDLRMIGQMYQDDSLDDLLDPKAVIG